MWRRFRRYLPFGIGTSAEDQQEEFYDGDEDEDDERREETSVDAPPGLFSEDDEEKEPSPGFSSARSSFRQQKGGGSPLERRKRGRTASASASQQPQYSPPRGKFLKRSETAPRSETRSSEASGKRPSSAVSHRAEKRKQSRAKKPSGTPHSEGDAPNSVTENLTSRLSRRSSIISDLVALMVRRSSSMGHRGIGREPGDPHHHHHLEEQPEHHHHRRDEDDEMDDEEDHDDMGNMPREKILERIRHHKEIIGKVRLQPWPMRRKRRALKVARQYLQRQEAQVSKWGLYKVELLRRCNQAWRWVKNLSIYLIPWESKIKQIESNFGSVVSSYFIFLRWVLGMNVANSLLIMLFVVVPEWLADSQTDMERFNRTRHIKVMPTKVAVYADELNTVLDFGGYLQYSYLFYGYYSHETVLRGLLMAYNVPVAYVCVNLFLLVFCIFIILKKMTSNTRKSKLSSGKQEQYVFTWKVVNGWDYNIGEYETAASLAMANAIKLKEASTEYKKKFKQKLTFQKLFVRFLVNLIIFSMMFLSMVAIYKVGQITEKDTFIKQNAVSITVAAITLLFPPIFELILKLEKYRPRTALRIHLFRVLFFYLLNYFTLVYSLFVMLNTLEDEMRSNEEWSQEQQFLSSQLRPPYQYQFHIVHSPMGGGGSTWNSQNNQSYYEVVSSPVLSSSSDNELQEQKQFQRLQRSRRPFLLFASVTAQQIADVRRPRWKRQFVHKHGYLGPKRKRKRPTPKRKEKRGESLRKEERDLNVLYSSQPFPGHEPASTNPPPTTTTRPWTTVQPHFGPVMVGLYNPQAFVRGGSNLRPTMGTVWESRPVGPSGGDWGTTDAPNPLNYTSSPKIASPVSQPYRASNYDELCWETLIGQEIAKIVTTDLVMTVAAILVIDFVRGLWIRYCSNWWCWDIEATFPEYGEFKVAENVLHLVNSQAMVCLGTILVPMLPLINCVKLVVVMYIRAWACMVCNVPAKQIFRASRSSNFYFWLLLAFVCMSTLPVGFVIAYKRPSKNCGPFAGQKRFYSIIGEVLQQNLPQSMVEVISYFMSPGIIFPVFLLLVLIIYFLVLLVNGLRAANSDLNKQLTLERTEEKRKIFELAKGKRQSNAGISHKSRPSGESKKSSGATTGTNGGSSGNGGGAESYATALANGNGKGNGGGKEGGGGGNGKGSRLSPLYFLNGAAKSGVRKSWHGGPVTGIGGPEPTEGILMNPLMPPKLSRKDSDDSGGSQSPSKSPLRHATFLPSLQSVDEKVDEEEEMDDEATEMGVQPIGGGDAEVTINGRKKRRDSSDDQMMPFWESLSQSQQPRRPSGARGSSDSNGTPNDGITERRSSAAIRHRQKTPPPPLRFSWKDRLLICIGWTDPLKLEAKLRRQMDEMSQMENGGRGGGGGEEEEERHLEEEEEQPLLREKPQKRDSRTIMPMPSPAVVLEEPMPVPLEEADYSVPSEQDDEEEEEEDEAAISAGSSSRGETVRMAGPNGGGGIGSIGIGSPRLASALSQASSGGRSSRRSQQLPTPLAGGILYNNRLADLLEQQEERPPSSGASSSVGTGSQRSWVRQRPTAGDAEIGPKTSTSATAFPKGSSPHPLLATIPASPTPSRGPSAFPTGMAQMPTSAQMPMPMSMPLSPPQFRRSSMNGALDPAKRAYIEREHVSESSPLSQRRHSPFPAEELARLSPDKRHPMSPRSVQQSRLPQSQGGGGLPPRPVGGGGGPMSPLAAGGSSRRASRESAEIRPPLYQRMDVSGSGSSSFGTRPPSDDLSLLLEEPATPIGHFRPISAEMLGASLTAGAAGASSSSMDSDPRLQYANPYSSYAAAMCSPILPTDEEEEEEHSSRTEFVQSPPTIVQMQMLPMPPMPSPSFIPQRQQRSSAHPSASMPFLQHRMPASTPMSPMPTPMATTAFGSPASQRRAASPESPQRYPSHQATPSSSSASGAPPLPRHGASMEHPMGMKRTLSGGGGGSGGYATPTPTMERRRAPPATQTDGRTSATGITRRPEPIYDQPLDQRRRPSTGGGGAADEGGSTSGRGTMPPGGYGSSPASTGSSPEFGRPKYKISSMSPGRSHREQQLRGEQESGSSPEGSPRRRFEIRQRSGLGLGRPLRIPTNGNNGGGGGSNGQGRNNGKIGAMEKAPQTERPAGEKQSIV